MRCRGIGHQLDHVAIASLDNASGGACLKGVLILVIFSKSVTFVVQIFYET
jgi:hypothetical protein